MSNRGALLVKLAVQDCKIKNEEKCVLKSYQPKARAVLNSINNTLEDSKLQQLFNHGQHDYNDIKRQNKYPKLSDESLLPEVSIENITENVKNTVGNSEHQFNHSNVDELREDDNSSKIRKMESNKCITVHSIVDVNQWYDCVIDPQDTSNLITLDKANDDMNPILATNISIGTGQRKTSHKKHACCYCKKIVYQISRHLLTVHSNEVEVCEIKELHADNPLRKRKLNILRNKGDFEYNKSSDDNIVVRKSTNALKNTTPKYVPCPSCLGYFIKENLRHHKNRCLPHKGDRKLQGNARKLQNYIHSRASDTLKNSIVPHMFHDEISNNFLFDEILILYGNYLCVKYTQEHLKNHVRAQLRLLGRLLLRAKVHNNAITCCKDLMQPIHCDTIRKAIDDIAELDLVKGTYRHPFNARTLGTAIQKVIGVIKSESIKKEDDSQLKICKSFLQVFKMDIAPYLNRICSLSEKKQKRIKRSQVKLPENSEIQKYFKYLLDHAAFHQERLEKEFSVDDWKHLAQYLLVALAVFNRKRPGEIQRLELEDFHRRQCISQKELNSLEVDDRLQADKYVRVGFGGKLGNSTAILINKDNMLPGLLIMLKYRHRAGVQKNNQFVFGAPSTNEHKTFSTYICHQTFLTNSGMDPSQLSFTNLRYHLATEVSKGGPSQEEEKRVSNYMSHDYTIHKNIYDQSAVLIDITKVSKHLEASSASNKVSRDRNVKRKRSSSDEYRPDLSPSSDEPDSKEVERCLGKLQHRKLWSSEEKDITKKYFKKELEGKKLIDKEKLKEFKEIYCIEMKNRTIPMIRQWIEMEKNKFQQKALGIKEKKPRYSTPERELLESSTEQHSLSGSEPSLQELENLIEQNFVFHRRTASSLLAKFKEMQRKKKFKK